MSSLAVSPFTKWDLERAIYSDPALNTTQRFVAIQILKSLDNKFRPLSAGLMSQALIGYRTGRWRETVNRALRHLVILGYFRTSWVSVPRRTAQGIKGVTRVMCELGPVLRRLVENNRSSSQVSAGQPHGVTPDHPSPTPPGRPGTDGGYVVAKSADRNGGASGNIAEFRRKTLEEWPRLAGRQQPTPVPPAFAELAERERAAIRRGEELAGPDEELSADEYAARLEERRRRGAARERAAIARVQPRHRPRSRR